ncbi:hypothetical protein ILUMI_21711 [Ignelater luminosus]|uniref:Glucosidase II subunit alpha n=1 Tax=Ignelater luminosus TaxID=2038154 RepID=A0A8K0CH66_IGNLU|nr:hypothetical protein ILUMI_21711 [Ignelater luminosus]
MYFNVNKKVTILFVLTLQLLIGVASGKTCDETFCGKLRRSSTGYPSYNLDLDTVAVEYDTLTANLTSHDGSHNLLLELDFEDIDIDEFVPPILRLAIIDSDLQEQLDNITFLNHVTKSPIVFYKATNETIVVSSGSSKAILYSNPFKMETYFENKLVSVVNGNGRLVIEGDLLNGVAAMDVSFAGAQNAYGIPLHAENLALRTTTDGTMDPYRLYNHNSGQYKLKSTEALHSAVPLLYTHGREQSAGVLWISYSDLWIDITHGDNHIETYFMDEKPFFHILLYNGPTIADAVLQGGQNRVTPIIMPQYFALGYHQSRNSYANENEVLSVIDKFNRDQLPLESVWLDSNYTDNGKYFTWDPIRFPNPINLQNQLATQNRSLVVTIGPHIKVEKGYFVHEEASSNGFYVTNPDGSDYVGKYLSGSSCSYIDFFNSKALIFYASLLTRETFKASNLHVFFDLNEPTVFENEEHENTLPSDVLHQKFLPHRYLHNMYGTIPVLMTAGNDGYQERSFTPSLSHSVFEDNVGPLLTGDNYANWEHLQISFPMCLSEALVNMNMCGANVGGFKGIPDEELYQRWYQAGAWLPFYRAHFAADVPPREPFMYPENVKARVRKALYQRYAHLPVWYTLFWENVHNFKPIIRPLFYHYPKEEATFVIDQELLLGANILAAPILKRGAFMLTVYLPGGESELWYNIDDNYKVLRGTGHQLMYVNLDSVPVFYRGGAIITRKDTPRLTSAETVNDPYTLYVCLNTTNEASGTLYVDDYKTYSYFFQNKFLYIGFSFTDSSLYAYKIVEDADYDGAAPVGEVVILNPPKNVIGVQLHVNDRISDNLLTCALSQKTCDETFCGPLRKSPEGYPRYNLDLSTVSIKGRELTGNLTSEDGSRKLYLSLTYHTSRKIGLLISDITLMRLLKTTHSINHELPIPLSVRKVTNETIVLTADNGTTVIYSNPFLIKSYYKDELVFVINGNGRLVVQNISLALDVTSHDVQQAYGIPLHADNLALRTTTDGKTDPYRLYNINTGQYKLKSTEALHTSVALLYTHGKTHAGAISWNSNSQTWIDITHEADRIETYFMSEFPFILVSLMNGPTIANVIAQAADQMDSPYLMPRYFALGYHQSRNSYTSESEVLNVINNFNTNNLPLESLWLDISHTDSGKYFTWDPIRFSNPIKLLDQLASDNRSLVVTVGPQIKREKGYFLHEEALLKGFYIRNKDGSDYIGKCPSGDCSYIEFYNTDASEYYSSLYTIESFKADNLHFFLDLNEPTVLNNEEYENTLPPSLPRKLFQASIPHGYMHNTYSTQHLFSAYIGKFPTMTEIRPFIATHSHSVIDENFSPLITGDNYASWEHLQISFPMCLSAALVTINMCRANVGGFTGIPDEELYQRWYQAGVWLPFYRAHFAADVPPREPYVYSDKVKDRVRRAMYQRYAHLPIWYTLFWENIKFFKPVIRPLVYHYPKEEETYAIDNQLLLGADILAAPVLKRGAFIVSIYLPGGGSELWYNIDDNYKAFRGTGHQIVYVNLDSVPVFYRGGSIIARKDTPRLTSEATVSDPYTLYICLNATNGASGTLYVDDYKTMSYYWKYQYLYVGFSFTDNSLYAYKIHENADYEGAAPIGEIVIVNPPKNIAKVRLERKNEVKNCSGSIAYSNGGNVLKLTNLSLNIREPFKLKLL